MNQVHIVAVGARTPVGLNAEATAAAVRAGISRVCEHPSLLDPSGEPVRLAMDGRLGLELMGWRRLAEMTMCSLREVMAKLIASGVRHTDPIEVYLGLPEYRPGWTSSDASHICGHVVQMSVPGLGPLRVRECAAGHAATLNAMGEAMHRIFRQEIGLCLVGGVDSYLNVSTLDWLHENRQLCSSSVRAGFSPGEGSGFVALVGSSFLKKHRLSSMGAICGAHAATETKLIKTDDINVAQALTEAVLEATRRLQLPTEAVDSVYCDINGERYRSEEWGFAALKLPHVCRDATKYDAPSTSWGDVGAASGVMSAILAVQNWRRRCAPGPRALLWAGSEAGLRAAVLLHHELSESKK